MTTKERLLREIQALTESEAAAVLDFVEQQRHVQQRQVWPPRFTGIARTRPDFAASSEEILRAELGSS